MVNNLSLLNKLKHKNSLNDSMKKPLTSYKHRLTRNIQSPFLQKSPLCSTPFKGKYRGESIFKFSPISITNDDNSPKYTTETDDNDDSNNSIVFIGNNKTRSHKCSKEIAKTSVDIVTNNSVKHDVDNKVLVPESKANAQVVFHKDISRQEKKIGSKNNASSSVEISSLQTTEVEPFLGFSNDANKEIITQDISLHRISDLYEIDLRNDRTEIEVNRENIDEDYSYNLSAESSNRTEDNKTPLESEKGDKDSSYDTCNSEQSSIEEKEVIKEPLVKIQRMNDSSFFRYYEKFKDFESEGGEDTDVYNDSLVHEVTDEYNMSTDKETDKSYMSRDDEIDKSYLSGEEDANQEDNVSQESEVLSQGEEFASFENSNDSNEQTFENSSSTDLNVDNYLKDNEASEYIDIASSNDDDGKSNEDEKCVSYVTTRRGNKVSDDPRMSIFNASYASSSTDCDKTVLSCNKETNKGINKESIDENETLINLNGEKQVVSDVEVLELRKDVDHKEVHASSLPNYEEKEDNRISLMTTRNSNITGRKWSIRNRKSSIKPIRNTFKESIIHSPEPSRRTCFEKPGIVLQPGKKWERSLSIFRRMTMMTDHFDQSILEDEPTENKGRKYRQSIIETMERQDLNGMYILNI